ncbi:MAG: thiamine phosphate synthase [Planctomycetaceae bacterium]
MQARRLDPARLAVYVVTSGSLRERSHLDVARAAIAGGATAVQLRAPELDEDALAAAAGELADACRAAGVLSIVNDRPDVAVAAGADGAHVGQGDDVEDARAALGQDRVLGISVASAEQARQAQALGADYLGVTVWATPTKPEAAPEGPEGVRTVAAATPLPVVGIGGIDADNAHQVVAAGAVGVAVVSAVAGAEDPVAATRALRAAVEAALAARTGGTRE